MSIRYSQDFKDLPVKLHHEGRSLKSLAEEFGPPKDSIAILEAKKKFYHAERDRHCVFILLAKK